MMGRGWNDSLGELIRGSDRELLIASPYVSSDGVGFVARNLPESMRRSGRLVLLTDLSPMPICQGSNDPAAIRALSDEIPVVDVYHLPKLHAKVYVSDAKHAIVTSGNLTRGGLTGNFEYGVGVADSATVAEIRRDVMDYVGLGARVSRERLLHYCAIADRLRSSYKKQLSEINATARGEFRESMEEAGDELIRIRLLNGSLNKIFATAIVQFLRRNGPSETSRIHGFVERAYPDLCDNSIDRVIDGVRFGKKWKHAVRTAQQHLKESGAVEYSGGKWQLTSGAGSPHRPDAIRE